MSYFDGGELLFASNIGLRVHGGKSRTGSPVQSFRLYFRRDYGSARFRPGTLFDGKGDPLTRLVAHNDLRVDGRGVWWHLVNPLAFDIVRQIGGLAPETQPASFVLNGVPQGLYVLVEHVREPFLMSRFGHENFDRADERRRRRWMRQVTTRPSVTQAELSTWLDVESLSRWFVSIVFCATTDPFQAVMFRDGDPTRGTVVLGQLGHGPQLHGLIPFDGRSVASRHLSHHASSIGIRGTAAQTSHCRRPGVSGLSGRHVLRRAQLSAHPGVPRGTGFVTISRS